MYEIGAFCSCYTVVTCLYPLTKAGNSVREQLVFTIVLVSITASIIGNVMLRHPSYNFTIISRGKKYHNTFFMLKITGIQYGQRGSASFQMYNFGSVQTVLVVFKL